MADWAQIREVFDAASQLPPAEREPYVRKTCSGSEEQSEVLKLLSSLGDVQGFLEEPVARVAGGATGVLAPGIRLKSRFVIEKEIGAGGFGRVYRASDEELPGKKVVIKILERMSADGWVRQQFEREIRTLSRIDHPGVVGIVDHGEISGHPFLVMQYVPGRNLRKVMQERPEPWPAAAVSRLLEQLASSLAAAHRQGVCHRDLKPENIIIRNPGQTDEQAVIIDFGIATLDERGQTAATTRVAGSPDYMAPEQLLGRPTTRSDIYSLGVIVFELLTGHRFYEDDITTQPETVAARKLAKLRRDLSSAARKAVARAVRFDHRARYEYVTEFSESFQRTLAQRRLPAPALWAAGIVLAVAAGWWLHPWTPWIRAATATKVLHPGAAAELHVTLWRLHPAAASGETPPLLHDPAPGQENLIPEPVDPAAGLRDGDRLRIGITSSRAGYLYVVIREQYANGSLGPPTLLFPSWRILGGLNSIPAGQALEIPEWSNPRPYFRIARPTPDQRHELLTVLVTPQPLQQLTPGGGSFRVPAEMLDAPPEGTALSSVRLPLLP